ncbi:FMN-binding negative transcriptional regulator [Marinobacter sp. ATCH36]|uniref:FMN-binding negative transcriptional regulator n=1 Tax=Marinobacter sp. ATCH36 TaxID=2945106 RepID=UPI002021CC05|nr:FMN-binding negative transcriptional regulator [Marinobacter sp. ATCH36]MCL7944657.1 FMN-binding negative transcriptional regulator [Marinobacter sp. ATCH36]
MYLPNSFKENDTPRLRQYIRDYGFGLLVIADGQGIEANHVPFHLECDNDDSLGSLHCHVARSNPVWKRLIGGARVLVVFQGPNGYVSPSWYATKAQTGRVVPTWNYLAVHAEGVARVIEDGDWLKRHLGQLTDQHESRMNTPWALTDAPSEYTDNLVKAIVGVEIRIESLIGKLKASQNQPEQNRVGVKEGFNTAEAGFNKAMSDFIQPGPGSELA